jgi:putative membrane-bound dehydrogenase-like protein
MKRFPQLALTLIAAGVFSIELRAADAPTPAVDSIKVPGGFTVELVAAAPLVEHPVMAGFDDRGRLFVADNAGLNLPAAQLLEKLPNMIRMLEDADGDGRFDKSTLFADKMTFPQGAAWYRGALYVASPPQIWRLEDTDGDGTADRRQELVRNFGFIGNAADIHGCFLTPTGRIAWCDGRHGHEINDPDGRPLSKGLAARVFSCRPDGSDVEVFCGGGMDNPVEIAFTPQGDTIGTMTFYNPDQDRHDAIVHFVYGGVYPRNHPCTSEFKRTGDLLPPLSRFGVTAPSGLMCYVGEAWGDVFRDNLFSAQFNTHKIVRHVLKPQGATYACVDEDFLVSSSIDFHPTDVLQDADGSLLVIDTGGWFRIGCPTSQIAKPQIGGGIYRIRRKDASPIADPRGLAMDWARVSDTEMADLLGDRRPAVAERAIEILATRGDAAMGSLATALFESTDYRARQNAVWALARNGSENARMLLRQVLSDDDAPARQAAAHAISDLRDAQSLPILLDLVAKDEPAVKREAATALGRLRNAAAVPALLAALSAPADRLLEHALIYALIEINDPPATLRGLSHASPGVQRAALIALDQMEGAKLTRELIAPLLATEDAALMRTIIEVLGRRPDWGDEIAGTLGTWLNAQDPSSEQLAMTRGAVAALVGRPVVERLVTEALSAGRTCKQTRLVLLEALAACEIAPSLKVFDDALRANLASSDNDVLRQAIATAKAIGAERFADRLLEIGLDQKRSSDLRVAALCAAAERHAPLPRSGFDFLVEQLERSEALRDRLASAEALGSFELSVEQCQAAAQLVERASPLEIAWLLRAFEHGTGDETGRALIAALEKSHALASIPPDQVRVTFKRYSTDVQSAAARLVEKLAPNDLERAAKLDALADAAQHGDVALGEDVFFSSRAACSACHRVGARGEGIGPDLTKIGEVRSRRDLAEAILLPSASLARGYESYQLATTAGKVFSGLVSRETASTIYLRTTERAEIRVARGDIDQLSPSPTSIMPQGLENTLSERELRDVVAYLHSLK